MARVSSNSAKTLSRELGISASTISRVINHPELVKEETRLKVLDGINKNKVDVTKQKREKTKTIGLTFSDPTSLFTSTVISNIELKLVNTDYQLMLFNLENRRDVYEYFLNHLEYLKKIDALIISSSTLSEKGSRFFKTQNIPLILFHSKCQGEQCILTNNILGGREAASFMLSRGYERLAFVGWQPCDEHIEERLDGFKSVYPLKEEYCIMTSLSAKGGYEASERLMALSEPPDAIFYACDAMAAGGIRYMREHNINVNKDVGIMGFDNLPIAELMGITTINQFVDSEISMAVDYILDRIENPNKKASSDEISITPKLVVRTSLK